MVFNPEVETRLATYLVNYCIAKLSTVHFDILANTKLSNFRYFKFLFSYTVYSEVHVTGRVLGFSVTVQTEVEKYK